MPSQAELDDLSHFVQSALTQLRVPGASVGLLHEDHEWTAAFGLTNVEHPLPVHTHTLFQIGSITKTFLGTAEGPDQGTEAELLRDRSGHFRYLRYAGRILTRRYP